MPPKANITTIAPSSTAIGDPFLAFHLNPLPKESPMRASISALYDARQNWHRKFMATFNVALSEKIDRLYLALNTPDFNDYGTNNYISIVNPVEDAETSMAALCTFMTKIFLSTDTFLDETNLGEMKKIIQGIRFKISRTASKESFNARFMELFQEYLLKNRIKIEIQEYDTVFNPSALSAALEKKATLPANEASQYANQKAYIYYECQGIHCPLALKDKNPLDDLLQLYMDYLLLHKNFTASTDTQNTTAPITPERHIRHLIKELIRQACAHPESKLMIIERLVNYYLPAAIEYDCFNENTANATLQQWIGQLKLPAIESRSISTTLSARLDYDQQFRDHQKGEHAPRVAKVLHPLDPLAPSDQYRWHHTERMNSFTLFYELLQKANSPEEITQLITVAKPYLNRHKRPGWDAFWGKENTASWEQALEAAHARHRVCLMQTAIDNYQGLFNSLSTDASDPQQTKLVNDPPTNLSDPRKALKIFCLQLPLATTPQQIAALVQVAKPYINRHDSPTLDAMRGVKNTELWKSAQNFARIAAFKLLTKSIENVQGPQVQNTQHTLRLWLNSPLISEHSNDRWIEGAFGHTKTHGKVEAALKNLEIQEKSTPQKMDFF